MVNGVSFLELDENRGTKDKSVVGAKLCLLETLMCDFLNVNQVRFEEILNFVKENVSDDINEDDIKLYEEIIKDLTKEFENKLILANNKSSLIAIVAYSCLQDVDLDEWFSNFLSESKLSYNQKENYIYMRECLQKR